MKISVQPETNLLTPEQIDDSFAMLKAAGFDGIDFSMDGFLTGGEIRSNSFGEEQIFMQEPQKVKEYFAYVKAASDKHGIEILQTHAPFPSTMYGNEELNEKMVTVLKNSITLTAYLGCKYIVIHPPFIPVEEYATPEQIADHVIAFYKQFISLAKELGVVVLLENMFTAHRRKIITAVCSEFEETVKYIDALNRLAGQELFGFCYDTGHAHLLGKDYYHTVKQLGHRIKALHVHDNNGQADQHVFPFLGLSNWERLIRALKEIGYAGTFNFEAASTTGMHFPPELKADAYTLLGKIGRYFVNKIEE